MNILPELEKVAYERGLAEGYKRGYLDGSDAVEQWISVEDRLPDYDEYVLWHLENGSYYVEALDKDGNPWLFGEEWQGFTYSKATHWQPLPLPPKSKT